jgi:hypothetical protein
MQDDNKFFQTLRTFQQTYKDSVATADDFKEIAEDVSGKDLSNFFNQWYYGQGYPTFNVDCTKIGDSLVLSVHHTSSAPFITPVFKGLYEFKIFSSGGDTTVKVNVTANNQQFKFRSNRIPTNVVVDPNNWILNKTGSITTGTDDLNVSQDVIVYPNPTTGDVFITFPANWFKTVQVFDQSGRMMRYEKIQQGSTSHSLGSTTTSGIFFIRLNGKGKYAVKKLMSTPKP